MANKVYLVIGCPASGKTWVCEQLKKEFAYVPHDVFIGKPADSYVEFVKDFAKKSSRPMLMEAPFSISQLKEPLERAGMTVICVFIQEDHNVIAARYSKRDKKQIPKGHLVRQDTYAARARQWGSFSGTTNEVLEHLKKVSKE